MNIPQHNFLSFFLFFRWFISFSCSCSCCVCGHVLFFHHRLLSFIFRFRLIFDPLHIINAYEILVTNYCRTTVPATIFGFSILIFTFIALFMYTSFVHCHYAANRQIPKRYAWPPSLIFLMLRCWCCFFCCCCWHFSFHFWSFFAIFLAIEGLVESREIICAFRMCTFYTNSLVRSEFDWFDKARERKSLLVITFKFF